MFYFISTLICILVNLLLGYIYRNSITRCDTPCKPTVATWLVFGLLTFVPIANIVVTASLAIFLTICYGEGDYKVSEKHWLGKRY